jgi:uncharacterized protein
VVAFETDDFDPIHHSGWSVAVTGVVREVSEPSKFGEDRPEPVVRWAAAGDESVLSISTEFMSGRRLTPGSLPTFG